MYLIEIINKLNRVKICLDKSRVNRNEILKYLQFRGDKVPDDISQTIEDGIDKLIEECEVVHYMKAFKIDDFKKGKGEGIFGFELEGEDIYSLLSTSEYIVFFAVTLGLKVDVFLRREQVINLSNAIIYESIASTLIELAVDILVENIEKAVETTDKSVENNEKSIENTDKILVKKDEIIDYTEKNTTKYFLTDRFSPGYGDLPLKHQPDVLRLLEAQKRLGINLTSSGLMIPRKSVTAIMGISRERQKKRFKGCEVCSRFMDCELRKSGASCVEGG